MIAPQTPVKPMRERKCPGAPMKPPSVRSNHLNPAVCVKLFHTEPPGAPRKAPVPSIRGRIGPPVPHLDLNN